MAIVEILDVKITAKTTPRIERNVGRFEIALRPGQTFDVYSLTIEGWFVPVDDRTQLWLITPGKKAEQILLNIGPSDLDPELDTPPSGMPGFRVARSVVSLPREFRLHVVARHPGRRDSRLASIHARRESLPSRPSRFQPIMLTSLGRTGGTWVTHLLGQHPGIVALRPFAYEARIAGYWMSVFAALAEPKSYLQSLGAEALGDRWWLGDRNLGPLPSAIPEPEFVGWLGKENVEGLLSSLMDRIEEAYDQVASLQHRPEASCFLERYWPNSVMLPMMWEIFPGAREIVLVRDFRDMTASIFAYNRKRGQQYFGRDAWDSDEEFVRSLGASARHLVENWKQRSEVSYLLKYEDLVARPGETLELMLGYLGLENGPDVIARMLESAGQPTQAQKVHQTSSSTEASVGRWRGDLDEHLRDVAQDTFGPVLAELGY